MIETVLITKNLINVGTSLLKTSIVNKRANATFQTAGGFCYHGLTFGVINHTITLSQYLVIDMVIEYGTACDWYDYNARIVLNPSGKIYQFIPESIFYLAEIHVVVAQIGALESVNLLVDNPTGQPTTYLFAKAGSIVS